MTNEFQNPPIVYQDPILKEGGYYKELRKKYITRLVLTYLVPLVVLAIYFYFQYRAIDIEGQRAHLTAVAENQAKTMDLFLRERIVNLSNIIDDPKISIPPSADLMENSLKKLQSNSDTFVDIGLFDSDGLQFAYAGPFSILENRDYSHEDWFVELKKKEENFIITDIYLGFRKKPHFTIAVNRIINNRYVVLRATLDPEGIYNYITGLEVPGKVLTSIVNQKGLYQLVTPEIGELLTSSPIVPDQEVKLGVDKIKINRQNIHYAYSWLQTSNWVLIVQQPMDRGIFFLPTINVNIIVFSFAIILIIFSIIIFRAKQIVHQIHETDKAKAQLSDNLIRASKLAAVGELAAGIAHEINNPVAIMVQEAGWVQDLLEEEEELQKSKNIDELNRALEQINTQGKRCKEITHKLLSFARKTDSRIQTVQINAQIEEILGLSLQRAKYENVIIQTHFGKKLPTLRISSSEIQQVLLNMFNNALDVMEAKGGNLNITTSMEGQFVTIEIADDGPGIHQDHLSLIFDPFFTTKPVGKGTGLGLSICYGIIKKMGGVIDVKSAIDVGTVFTIKIPITKESEE
jgi:two-component system, NtrC family, sensor kinase